VNAPVRRAKDDSAINSLKKAPASGAAPKTEARTQSSDSLRCEFACTQFNDPTVPPAEIDAARLKQAKALMASPCEKKPIFNESGKLKTGLYDPISRHFWLHELRVYEPFTLSASGTLCHAEKPKLMGVWSPPETLEEWRAYHGVMSDLERLENERQRDWELLKIVCEKRKFNVDPVCIYNSIYDMLQRQVENVPLLGPDNVVYRMCLSLGAALNGRLLTAYVKLRKVGKDYLIERLYRVKDATLSPRW
jgi:hypothetical protein